MVTATEQVTTLERTRVGRYTLKRKIAQGGMASVYLGHLATGHGFEKWVAVKVMHPHLVGNRIFVNMFLDEARLVARIQHPNVCSVLDFGEDDGLLYLVMEYLHGESLSSVIGHTVRAGGTPMWLAARLVADTARGLHAAHEQRDREGHPLSIVHRDVSPQNIHVLYDGVAKIVDFGVAHASGRITTTVSGEVKGKFAYMSPEQLRGEAVDRRTDVWALGVVLWEATVGKRLFRAESQGQTAVAVLQEEITAPSKLRSDYPPLLEKAILGALERNLEARTANAAELADSLEMYLKQQPELGGPAQVQAWMNKAFADRRDRREELLRAKDGEITVADDALFDSRSTLGSLLGGVGAPTRGESPAGAPSARQGQAERTRARLLWPAAVLLGLMALGAGLWWSRGTVPGGPAEASETAAMPEIGEAPQADESSATERAAPPADEPSSPEPIDATDEPASPATESPTRRVHASSGTLNLFVLPAVEVLWNGRSLGHTPLMDARLPAGRHTLTLRPLTGGADERIRVVIRPGGSTRRSVRLGGE